MAISANSAFEVRSTGSDTNGGGFVTGAAGTDYSQQDAAQYSGTDLASSNGTTAPAVVTSASHSFASTDVGNLINVSAGTSWTAGIYQIVSVSAGAATLDRAVGSAATLSGGTYAVGGALASPGKAAGAGLVNGNVVWIRSGSYAITTATANVAGGCVSAGALIRIEGYGTTRGDLGTPPVLTATGIASATLVLFNSGSNESTIRNITLDGAGLTSIRGIDLAARSSAHKCWTKNCSNYGISASTASGSNVAYCRASGCKTQAAFYGGPFFSCEAYSNTISGFASATCFDCLSYGNTGASSHGFTLGNGGVAVGCVAYGNGGAGFFSGSGTFVVANSIASQNSTSGFNLAAYYTAAVLNCASYLNTGGNTITGVNVLNTGFVTLAGDPFVNAAGGNFALNSTAGAGASARGAGFPGTFPAGTSTGYPDIGAVQHQDSGGGGTVSGLALSRLVGGL